MGKNNIGWLITKGIISIIFGMILFTFSEISADLLIILFGWFVFLIGLTSVIASMFNKSNRKVFLTEGIFGIIVGILMVYFPIIGAITLSWTFAFWLLVSGFIHALFFNATKDTFSKVLYIILGIFSILVAIYMILIPSAGVQVLVKATGLYAIVIGIGQLMIAANRSRISQP